MRALSSLSIAPTAVMVLSFALLGPACGPPGEEENGPPNGGPVDENIATALIGPDGGSLSVGSCWVSFPAGALQSEATITVTRSEDSPPAAFQAFSSLCTLEPFDLELMAPANVKLGFQGEGDVAALFHDAGETDSFARIGGAVDGSWIGAHVPRLGRFFVAHGTEFDPSADTSCARTRIVGGRIYPEHSSVALSFAAEDCQGRPMPDLELGDLTVRENASTRSSLTSLADESRQVFISLVIDVSTPMQLFMNEIIEAVRAFIDVLETEGVGARLSLDLFGGGDEPIVWRPHLIIDEGLRESLADMVFDLPEERTDPNLHGALASALDRLAVARSQAEENNHGGTFTSGFVLLLASQPDGAGLLSLEDVVARVEEARENEGVRIMAVGLHGNDYDPISLDQLAPDGVSTARGARLSRETSFQAWRIARTLEAEYRLAFCSEQTSGSHTAGVELSAAEENEMGLFSYSADGFGAPCDQASLAVACEGKECGGLVCGACDDRELECDDATAVCTSFCERPEYCAGDTFTNPRGYEQTCPSDDTNTRCGNQCVDITSNEAHCGECWEACNEGFYCSDRECLCPDGLLDCDGVCRDTTSDPEHCGDCDLPCAEGGECHQSACRCPGEDGRVCHGVCVDVAVDPDNCGGCDLLCADQRLTSCNHGTCGGLQWSASPMPNPAGAGLPNPAGYATETETVTDQVTGLVWQRQADPGRYNWQEAHVYCRGLDFGDGHDWRLPSRIEIISLVDFSAGSPAIDSDTFPGSPADWTWSSSPRAGTTTQAWAVDFGSGDSGIIMTGIQAAVRCVRN